MTIAQTVDISADRRITLDVPPQIPMGRTNVIIQFPEQEAKQNFEPHPCPECRELQDPVTGEMRYGPETRAGMQEVDDMLAGKIPNTLKSFNSLEEMLADLKNEDEA